jgi:thiol-disulfide isomerase/thioredoxin
MTVRAPEIPAGLAWFNGGPLRLGDLRDRVVLLEFWTAGCVNCHHNIPQLHALQQRFGDAVVVIGVHSAKFPAERAATSVGDAVERLGIRYPVLHDEGLRLWDQYAVRAWPTLVVVDPSGRIAATHVGEWLADDLAPSIEAMLAAGDVHDAVARTPVEDAPAPDRERLRRLRFPSRVVIRDDKSVFVADTGHHRVLMLYLDHKHARGTVTRVWGTGEPGLRDDWEFLATFHHPRGMAVDMDYVFVADTDNHAVRAIDIVTGGVQTWAGDGTKAHGRIVAGDARTPLRSPWAVASTMYTQLIAMTGAHQIWEVMIADLHYIPETDSQSWLDDPRFMAVYSTDPITGSQSLVDNVRTEAVYNIHPIVGTGYESLEDGPPDEAGFSQPSDMVLDGDTLYVVDAEASAVRVIADEVRTLVGRGLWTFGDQDGVGDDVRLQHPTGIAAHDGMVYIADTLNHKIKLLDPATRRVTTLIGTGEAGHRDGAWTEATLNAPEGVVVRGDWMLVADTGNHAIRLANVQDRTIRTLHIDNDDLLVPPRNVYRTPTQKVALGEVTMSIHVALPPGYKHNPDARISVTPWKSDEQRTFDAREPLVLRFGTRHDMDIRHRTRSTLVLDLVLYPCSVADGVCLFHEVRLVVPLVLAPNGPHTVDVRYDVKL